VRWSACFAALATLATLQGCGSGKGERKDRRSSPTDRARSEVKPLREASMPNSTDNPAERPGVEVYRPQKLESTQYNMNSNSVVDRHTGDTLQITRIGYAGGPGAFKFRDSSNNVTGNGTFLSLNRGDVSGYEITSILLSSDNFTSFRSREEYNASKLANLFGALAEAQERSAQPESETGQHEYMSVIDARPKTVSEINPRTGQRRIEQ